MLGCELVRTMPDGTVLRGRIVETEAYDQTDPASHSHTGRTERSKVMFGPPGRAYVYITYGMYFCFNVVTGEDGYGSAVLIRALEPLEGLAAMRRNRPDKPDKHLTDGPAKLCQAFLIDKALYGHELSGAPLQLVERPAVKDAEVTITTRIGITKGVEYPWRYYLTASRFVSKR